MCQKLLNFLLRTIIAFRSEYIRQSAHFSLFVPRQQKVMILSIEQLGFIFNVQYCSQPTILIVTLSFPQLLKRNCSAMIAGNSIVQAHWKLWIGEGYLSHEMIQFIAYYYLNYSYLSKEDPRELFFNKGSGSNLTIPAGKLKKEKGTKKQVAESQKEKLSKKESQKEIKVVMPANSGYSFFDWKQWVFKTCFIIVGLTFN